MAGKARNMPPITGLNHQPTTAATLDTPALIIAVTGVGGPDAEEGLAAGTVWLAVRYRDVTSTRLLHLQGDPSAICDQTCTRALDFAYDVLAALNAIGGPH